MLQNARFLQHELPIRMAQRVEELVSLPDTKAAPSQGAAHGVQRVVHWYMNFIESMLECKPVTNHIEEQRFCAVLSHILQHNQEVRLTWIMHESLLQRCHTPRVLATARLT